MSSSDIAISIRNLSKAYTIAHGALKRPTFRDVVMERVRHPFHRPRTETFWALKDVSFDVKKGEVVGIIGRNGAGKSTLLKILSRITEPTSGRIELYGRVGSLLEVGTGFHPELTGRENVFLNGAILGMSRAEIRKQFDAIVDFAEVEQFIDTPVKRYSSGMYVRLAFAVAAHLNPEILIVDEVLAVGDAQFQKKCLNKMGEVARGGRTVLFVSHNMAAVRILCARGAVLSNGEVAFVGGSKEAVEYYANSTANEGGSILDFVKFRHENVSIREITVNGSPSHEIRLKASAESLDISVSGQLKIPLRLDIELSICDRNGTTLAFYGTGHLTGVTPKRPAGPFQITRSIALPRMLTKGDYLTSIDLTDHNVCYWLECPGCVRLFVEGTPTPTGSVLEYDKGKGFILLSAHDDVRSDLRDGTSRHPAR